VREKNVPIYSFVEDYAASGGYWLACVGQKIYVSRSSIVGNVGVIAGLLGFHELIQKWGIERRLFKAGKNVNASCFLGLISCFCFAKG
jgi:ClpP class serine protease